MFVTETCTLCIDVCLCEATQTKAADDDYDDVGESSIIIIIIAKRV